MEGGDGEREGWHVTWLWQTAHNWHPSKPAEYTSRYRVRGGWGRKRPRGWCRWACGTGYLSPASCRAWRSRWPSLWRRWWREEPLPGRLSATREHGRWMSLVKRAIERNPPPPPTTNRINIWFLSATGLVNMYRRPSHDGEEEVGRVMSSAGLSGGGGGFQEITG